MGVEKMRDRMERFTVLPFSMGCVSHASVNVAEQRPRKSRSDFKSPSLRNQDEEDDDESLSAESMKHSSRFLALPKPHISTGVNKLVKGFKSLSQLFIYEDEMEELGIEMEIGCPTDVKHVTHIGWDGSASANPIMGWHNLISPELLGHHHLHHSSAAPLGHFPQPSAAPENKTPAFASAFTASSPTTA